MADRHITVQIAMARDWAGICQRKATEWTGTPEGAEYLAHSKRYASLAETLSRLASPAPQELPPVTPPKPDTHCFDDDTGKDVWSYSAELVLAAIAADRLACAKARGE